MKRLFYVAGSALIGAILLYFAIWAYSALALRSVKAKLEKAGRPMGPYCDGIVGKAKATENAAPLYIAAWKILESCGYAELLNSIDVSEISEEEAKANGRRKFESEEEKCREFLQDPRVMLATTLVHEGSLRDKCDFNLDYDEWNLMLPHLIWLRDLNKLMNFKARLEAKDGKENEAWQSALVGIKLADALHDEAFLISQCARTENFMIAFNAVKRVANIATPGDEVSNALVNSFKRFESRKPFIDSFDVERIRYAKMAYEDPCKLMSFHDSSVKLRFCWLLPTHALDEAFFLKETGRFAEKIGISAGLKENPLPFYSMLSTPFVCSFSYYNLKCMKLEASAKIAVLALKAFKFKSANGRFPERLELIASGDEAADPFSKEDFIYKSDENSFLIASASCEKLKDRGPIEWRHPEKTKQEAESKSPNLKAGYNPFPVKNQKP